MTSFKINNDDLAVRGLQQNNKMPVISGPVLPVKASNPVQKSPENISLISQQTERRAEDSQSSQRRQIDRRKLEKLVLLDTRSQHDRRIKTGRASDIEKDIVTTFRGVNETV